MCGVKIKERIKRMKVEHLEKWTENSCFMKCDRIRQFEDTSSASFVPFPDSQRFTAIHRSSLDVAARGNESWSSKLNKNIFFSVFQFHFVECRMSMTSSNAGRIEIDEIQIRKFLSIMDVMCPLWISFARRKISRNLYF